MKSLEQTPIQRAELERLQHLVATDVLLAREVCEGVIGKWGGLDSGR